MSRCLFAAVLIGTFLVGGIAYGTYVDGTDGVDDVVIERSGSTAYLKGGDDSFTGARGSKSGGDHVFAGDGADRVISYGRVDILRGQQGDDHLDGGAGRDGLYGWGGDDTLIGGPGQDSFRPGPGVDTCIAEREDLHLRRCERLRFTD